MIRIVIADDNEFLLEQLVKFLKSYDEIDIVGIAKNGKEELYYIEKLEPDLIITDIEMPLMTGIEVIEGIEKIQNKPQIIVVTGTSDFITIKKLYELSVDKIFNKPLNFSKLVDEILLLNKENS